MKALNVATAADMEALGVSLGQALQAGVVVYLQGELGAGKTTLVRGVLKGLGYKGPVRSPTYTLVESYELAGRMLYHLDFYRIRGQMELEFLGIRDLDDPQHWMFVEWPERGAGGLPSPDLLLRLEAQERGRTVLVEAKSGRGHSLVAGWLAKSEATQMDEN